MICSHMTRKSYVGRRFGLLSHFERFISSFVANWSWLNCSIRCCSSCNISPSPERRRAASPASMARSSLFCPIRSSMIDSLSFMRWGRRPSGSSNSKSPCLPLVVSGRSFSFSSISTGSLVWKGPRVSISEAVEVRAGTGSESTLRNMDICRDTPRKRYSMRSALMMYQKQVLEFTDADITRARWYY